jgi:hypothetical protein
MRLFKHPLSTLQSPARGTLRFPAPRTQAEPHGALEVAWWPAMAGIRQPQAESRILR